MKRLMAAAHALIEQGFYVFPLRPGDKRPLPHFKHWEQRATRDPDRVYQWWSMAPYNIRVATGPSQLLVVDCDTRPDNAALDWRNVKNRMWILGQQLPQTFSVRTPSSGLHLYFAAPETWLWETQQANSASTLTRGVPAATSLAPGSVHSGRLYVVVDRFPIAPLPTWITELLAPRQVSQPSVEGSQRISSSYLRAILEGEAERVRSAKPGTRNHALNTAAFLLGQLVGSGEIAEEYARLLLRNAGQLHIGVKGFTEAELEQTAKSGLTAGMQRPKRISP